MASFKELKDLNGQGILSQLLVEKFDGRCGFITEPDRKDANLTISFTSTNKTPSAKQIREVVIEHFTKLGYVVKNLGKDILGIFEAYIYFQSMQEGFVVVVISANYPQGDYIRLTTNIHP
ncbi:MAG: hypothetical protein WC827_02585 [Candidatus Paceibacterota bacterium]|jgi:hypothetical protein